MTVSDTEILLRALAAQRRHVLGVLDGLDGEQLQRPVLPSGWSCAQLVHHLAVDDERFWFRAVIAGDREVVAGFGDLTQDAWTVPAELTPLEVLDLYRSEADQSDAVLRSVGLDAAPAWWPVEAFGDWRLDTVGQVVLHVLTETASHAGHLDAARELIDGRQWLVVP